MTMQTSDTKRLRWLMQHVGDGFVNVLMDRHEYALVVAYEEGRKDGPTEQDEFDGFRRMIDCAMLGGDK